MKRIILITLVAALLASNSVLAYEINKKLSIGGVLATAGQCQILTENADSADKCRGAVPSQPEISFRPTEVD